ncbi:hypothetical protein ERJ75_001435900 [Trypanosoma vivax]|nr:hypothetical protein TRVL_03702 [Trypanosoma vivax]KAH8607025.1 hypothetical protein ERJ75_001435900 [Trypanosoma vivax]
MLRGTAIGRLLAREGKSQRQPRRTTHHAVSSARLGKERFDLAESLRRDRERAEQRRSLPWRERLSLLQDYPWKFFVAFMVFWSWFGTYAVPYFKGVGPGVPSQISGDGRTQKGRA